MRLVRAPGVDPLAATNIVEGLAACGAQVTVEPVPFAAPGGRVAAAPLLASFVVGSASPPLRILLSDGDGHVAHRNHVFGVAAPGGAVVFLARLGSVARAVNVVLHEAGHAAGLVHCSDRCVMRFSRTVADVDERPTSLCNRCASIAPTART